MRTTAKKWEKIRFLTYKCERNSGMNVLLGDKEVLVETLETTVTEREGCTSAELVPRSVHTVMLDGRRFIIEQSPFWRVENDGPRHMVQVPFPFVPSIFPRLTSGFTDEKIIEKACVSLGCTNFAANGTCYCSPCLHGRGAPLPADVAKRKLELEKENA